MNQIVKPTILSFEIKIDGGIRAGALTSWTDATHLRLTTAPGAAPLVDVTLELLVADPNFKSTMSKVVQPFGPELLVEV